jgi:hypothetical protein
MRKLGTGQQRQRGGTIEDRRQRDRGVATAVGNDWLDATSNPSHARSGNIILYTGGRRALLPDGRTVHTVAAARNAGPTGLQVRLGRRVGTGGRQHPTRVGGLGQISWSMERAE